MRMWSSPLQASHRLWMLIFASTLILYLIFSPSIHILHYSGDDFRYSFGGMTKSCAKNDDYHFMLTIGRPLQTFIDCLGFKFAYTLEGMRVIRIVTVVTIGVTMGLLADWLYILGFSLGTAFFAAGSLLLIAHLYGDAVPMGAIALPFTLLLTLMGYRCVNKAHQYFFSHESRTQAMKWLSLSFLIVLAALLTYPALAFFFVTLMLMKLLFSKIINFNRIKRELLIECLVFITGCLVYFAFAYYNIHYHARTEIPAAYHVGHPNLNIIEMFNRLFLLGNLFSPWWTVSPMSDSNMQGWIMIAGLLGIMMAPFMLRNSKHEWKNRTSHSGNHFMIHLIQVVMMGVGLFLLSSAFYLVMPSLDIVENRILYAIVTSGLVLVFWGCWQWKNIFPARWGRAFIFAGVAILFLIEGHQASMVTMVNALSHVEYFNDTREAIAHYLQTGQPLARVHFVIPKSNAPYGRYALAQAALVSLMNKDSFKLRWCALSSLGNHHTQEAAHCLANMRSKDIAVTYSFENEPFLYTRDMVKIQNEFRSLSIG